MIKLFGLSDEIDHINVIDTTYMYMYVHVWVFVAPLFSPVAFDNSLAAEWAWPSRCGFSTKYANVQLVHVALQWSS